ncbi:hypothetical protein HOLleu_02275 [Holothuria leucospilota]|uniref:Uncharacterized protein n=1 Tax=Holothuria leucospilota TaxID=206669 RepID=A0A9Q1CQG4_HOLLE|nr:hypothetical protein HOLleu_02275 [Holothuria leucospilota]
MMNQTGQQRQGTYKRYLFGAEKTDVPRNTKKRWLEKSRQTLNLDHQELSTVAGNGDRTCSSRTSSIPNEPGNNPPEISETSLNHDVHNVIRGGESCTSEDASSSQGLSESSQDAQDVNCGDESRTFVDSSSFQGHSDFSQDAQVK